MVPCAPSNRTERPLSISCFRQQAAAEFHIFFCEGSGVQRNTAAPGLQRRLFLLYTRFHQAPELCFIRKIAGADAAAAHLIFVGGANAPRGGSDLAAPRRIL